ncbi:dihydrolipoyl dehydrogenase [Paraliomyxa miuraensis]|uniref:dihydrolipoyl dehydrogenase n=1 Tax=Paraliomyxa miuraensis TaxID=376150 RepID=UPI00224E86EC|nr:dihydrolipoyl dehydrogenase [Paraliomyxa miuraensis]MCX4246468.1 dihydrolipoyl dehydrogenase [Paraliomyxa miuraensis]
MATIKKTALVIGAGTGGYPCAIRLGQLGVDAMLVEKGEPGGVCLNVGCIPSKALISATKLAHKASHAETMGLRFGPPQVDMVKMQEWKSGIVRKLTSGVKGLVKGNGTEYRQATATFLGPKQVQLTYADGSPSDVVEAEHIVIATGSVPIEIPGFAYDGKRILDSTGALALDHVPESMIVIGGGYIGLELGQTFQRVGTKLTVVEGLDRLLPAMDKDLAQVVTKQIKDDGGEIVTGARAKGWTERDGMAVVQVEVGGELRELSAEVVLVAVGRRPVTQGLGLEKTGVKLDKGFIVVDQRLQTNVPGIYATGDVVGQPMLAHKATHEAEVVAEVIAGRKSVNDARVIPAVVFTEPEIATAGLSKDEAEAKGHKVGVGKFPFSVLGRAMAIDETKGFVKIVIDADDERVLGVSIVGPEASDLISEASLAIEMGAYAPDIGLTIHPHPTLGEAMMEAAKHAVGEAIHIQNPRKR